MYYRLDALFNKLVTRESITAVTTQERLKKKIDKIAELLDQKNNLIAKHIVSSVIAGAGVLIASPVAFSVGMYLVSQVTFDGLALSRGIDLNRLGYNNAYFDRLDEAGLEALDSVAVDLEADIQAYNSAPAIGIAALGSGLGAALSSYFSPASSVMYKALSSMTSSAVGYVFAAECGK